MKFLVLFLLALISLPPTWACNYVAGDEVKNLPADSGGETKSGTGDQSEATSAE